MLSSDRPSSHDPRPFVGMTAAVTGAASGIGRAIALELARRGADLVLHTRANRQGLDEVAEQVVAGECEVHAVSGDLANVDDQDALVEDAWGWREIDVWVNNAGADVLIGHAASWSFERKLEVLWQVDVLATIRLARQVGQRMKQRGHGIIVNMGWDQAETGMAGGSGEMFAAVKGAVMAFTKSLAKSLAPEVRVNCIAPGWVRTQWGEQASEYWQERAAQESLLRRWGTPQDVARVVAFLAGKDADFLTGQIIHVDGGLD